jgi:hypothetical protein
MTWALEADLEGWGQAVIRAAGLTPDVVNCPLLVAGGIFGPENIKWGNARGRAARYNHDEGRLYVRFCANDAHVAFWVSHECGEYWLFEKAKLRIEQIEQICHQLAYRIIAPAPAFRDAVTRARWNIALAAPCFRLSQAEAWLRAGEVFGRSIAVVGTGRGNDVAVRGDRWLGSTADDLRWIARTEEPLRGIDRLPITDAPGRVVLVER